MATKILAVLGQPQKQSYGAALMQAYVAGARTAGAEVRELYLGDLQFNAVAAGGPAPLEPDLAQAQESIKWAEHLVFVYPIWWGTIPALLKGFIERAFAPGFAVNFRKDSPLWDKLLKGRSARLIVTLNTPSFIYRWVFGRPGHNTMKRTILEFCGIKPVRITEVGPINGSTEDKRKRWLDDVRALGARDA
jgi:putative NADPH-quinone reductase